MAVARNRSKEKAEPLFSFPHGSRCAQTVKQYVLHIHSPSAASVNATEQLVASSTVIPQAQSITCFSG